MKKLSLKKYLSLFLLLILSPFFSLPLFARGAQELVPCGHWVYDALTAISLDAGILNFSGTAPVTIGQIRLYMDEIDYDSLSDTGRSDYDRIERYFDEKVFAFFSDILSVGLEPSLNIEGFYKSNSDIDWVYDRYQREPMFGMPFYISLADYISMSMDVLIAQNKGASLKNYNYTNILYSPDDFDINFPDNGYFSTGIMLSQKTGVGFQLGKGSRSVGRTLTGSMIWSDYLTGISYGLLEFYSPFFKYSGGVSQFNVDKYLYHHQLDLRLFKKFEITVMEGLLVYAPIELRYLNPWMIFHGIAAWREYNPSESDPESNTCDYFAVNMQFTPFKYTRFYGTFCFTQMQTPYEKANFSDSPTPDGMGAQAGNESYIPFGSGRIHLGIEGSWAQPYLYIKESPNWSMVRTYSDNMGDKAIFYEWLGSPFGPDTISGEFTAGYEIPEKWSMDFIYLFMARGENSGNKIFERLGSWGGQKTAFSTESKEDTQKWAYPSTNQSNWEELRDSIAPTGTPEFVNRFSLRGAWKAKPWLTFKCQPSFVMIFNRNNESGEKAFGFEIATGVSINFIKLRK